MAESTLSELFSKCLTANYIHTPNGGDYALQDDPHGQCLYVLFEWSDGREDWKNNLSFSVKPANPNAPRTEKWYAHRGFLKVWRSMETEVVSRVKYLIRATSYRTVICVGYSHGAALALLATEALSRYLDGITQVDGYGFGSPRVIWGRLPEKVYHRLEDFHTIRNIPDLVTHLPPAVWGYRHVNLSTVGEKGKYGPIKAHTSQAYVSALSQTPYPAQTDSSTKSATDSTKFSKTSADKWVFRWVYPATPRR